MDIRDIYIAELQDKNERLTEKTKSIDLIWLRINQLEAALKEATESEIVDAKRRNCLLCSQDIYEQQQNYERIKEELYEENETLRNKLENATKEYEELKALYKREKDNDWGGWRTRALELEKELRNAKKDIEYQRSCVKAAQYFNEEQKKENKLLNTQVEKFKERIKYLEENSQTDYKEKWQKAEAEKLQILRYGRN
jgi:Rad3-related DNA helicase